MLIVTFITNVISRAINTGGHVKESLETVICCWHWVNKRGGYLAVSTYVEQEYVFEGVFLVMKKGRGSAGNLRK